MPKKKSGSSRQDGVVDEGLVFRPRGGGGKRAGGGRGRGRGGGFNAPIAVSEDFRMAVNLRLQDFRNREDEKEYEFPSSLASTERCYIHRLAKDLGLQTKSRFLPQRVQYLVTPTIRVRKNNESANCRALYWQIDTQWNVISSLTEPNFHRDT